MNATTNPTNAYTVPSVSITTARTGASSKANELGMRAMQERAYAKRGEQYLLIKSPPASEAPRFGLICKSRPSCKGVIYTPAPTGPARRCRAD